VFDERIGLPTRRSLVDRPSHGPGSRSFGCVGMLLVRLLRAVGARRIAHGPDPQAMMNDLVKELRASACAKTDLLCAEEVGKPAAFRCS